MLVATIMGFINDNGLKLSAASLAYYTVFSIAPLLINNHFTGRAGMGKYDAATNKLIPANCTLCWFAASRCTNTGNVKKPAAFGQVGYGCCT